jgi:hypothetical protein
MTAIKFRKTRESGDIALTFSSEDGKHYRGTHQNLDGAIQHVQRRREIAGYATRSSNPNEWEHIGSVPMAVLVGWLDANNYKMDEWARNDGGTRCPAGSDPVAHATLDGGVRSQFLRYFLSRDFSKLHNQHVTTKRERSSIVVPDIGFGDEKLRRTTSGNSKLA